MSRDQHREEQRLRNLLNESARAHSVHDEPPDDDLLHVRPKVRPKKKPKIDQ